jgi:transposase
VPLGINLIIGVSGLAAQNLNFHGNTLWVNGRLPKRIRCPLCDAPKKFLRKKDSFPRKIQHDSLGQRKVVLCVTVPKFHCERCNKYFRQPIPSVKKYQRSTESFKQDVVTKHHLGFSKDACARLYGISHSTVESHYKYIYSKDMNERKNRSCPRVLGLDEHFLNKKTGYVTTMVDLKTRRVFNLLPGRSEASLEAHLKRLKGRHLVRVVVMDMSSTYRSIVQKYFSNAVIVADRFHVVRLINHTLLDLWKCFDEKGRKHRGLISLMRRHRFNLSPEQKENLARYFKEFPALGICYHKLKDLKELMLPKGMCAHRTRRQLIPKLLSIIDEFKNIPFEPLKRLAKTLESWLEPIARMWRFRRTNSTTEGLHNKMELIQRRAYGFKSFENYRIRVIALCG